MKASGQDGGLLAVMRLPGGLGIDEYMTKPEAAALMAERPWRRPWLGDQLWFHNLRFQKSLVVG